MINRSQQVLLDAIQASLFGRPFSYPDDTDWNAVINEAKAQAVTGLISPVIPVHDESSDKVKAYSIRLLYEQDKLLKFRTINLKMRCILWKRTVMYTSTEKTKTER